MEQIISSQLFEKIKPFKNFGIGLHGIRTLCTEGKSETEVARLIMEQGLKLGRSYGSINGNVTSVGISGIDDANITDKLQNYCWGSKQANIIVAYPAIIENSKGEKLYLGYTKSPTNRYDQDTPCSLMDQACSSLGYIPKEFILGYYIDSQKKYGILHQGEHITYDFEQNPEFCGGEQVSDDLFDTIAQSLMYDKDLSIACINAIDKLDIDILEATITSEKRFYELFGSSSSNINFLDQVYEEVRDRIQEIQKTTQNTTLTLQQFGQVSTEKFESDPKKANKAIDQLETGVRTQKGIKEGQTQGE